MCKLSKIKVNSKLLTILLTLVLMVFVYLYFTKSTKTIIIDSNINYKDKIDSLNDVSIYYASMYDSIKKSNLALNNDIALRDSIITDNQNKISQLYYNLKIKNNEIDNNSDDDNAKLLHKLFPDVH